MWVIPHTYGGGQSRYYQAAACILLVDVYCPYPITVVLKTTDWTLKVSIRWLVFVSTDRACLRGILFRYKHNINSGAFGFVLDEIGYPPKQPSVNLLVGDFIVLSTISDTSGS